MNELNLTYTQYIVMLVLWETDPITEKEMGKKLYLDSGTLTPVLKSLETKKYIVRSRSKEDERVVIVNLTKEGAALKDKAVGIPEQLGNGIPMDKEDQKVEKTRRKSEAQMKASKAVIAMYEAEELKGTMHRAEDVKAMTEDLVYTIRGALMALPGRLAVDVAACDSPSEASEVIRKEVYQVMRELAGYRYDPKKYEERVRERRDWTGYVDDED